MSDTETAQQTSMVKLIVGVTVGILVAAAVLFVAWQAMKPQDCALQRLEVQTGERLESDLSDACRE